MKLAKTFSHVILIICFTLIANSILISLKTSVVGANERLSVVLGLMLGIIVGPNVIAFRQFLSSVSVKDCYNISNSYFYLRKISPNTINQAATGKIGNFRFFFFLHN